MATGDKLVNLDVLKNTVQKEVVDLKSAVSKTEINAEELKITDKNICDVFGLDTGIQEKTLTVGPLYYANTARLATAVPYNVNGIVKKITVVAGIGNTSGYTGKLYCGLVRPDDMKSAAGTAPDSVPCIAKHSADVTAGSSSQAADYSSVTFDFSDDDIPKYQMLYVLLYVVPDNSANKIYIRTLNYYQDNASFPLDFVAANDSIKVYYMQNGSSTMSEAAYNTGVYANISMEIERQEIAPTILENQWAGKICACIGTSLTANGGWMDVLKSRFGFSKMYNRGAGGTTLADYSSDGLSDYVTKLHVYDDTSKWAEDVNTCIYNANDIPEGYENYTHNTKISAWYSAQTRINTLPTGADLVLIDLAMNDYFRVYNNNLGWDTKFNVPQINTPYRQSANPPTYDITKFGDAFAIMIKGIMTRCPNAKIVVWGMLYNNAICNYDAASSQQSDSLEKYLWLNDYIKNICGMFGVVYIDTIRESGMNVFNVSQYCEDGVHPYKPTYATEKGKYAVANVLTKHLMNLYPKDYMSI